MYIKIVTKWDCGAETYAYPSIHSAASHIRLNEENIDVISSVRVGNAFSINHNPRVGDSNEATKGENNEHLQTKD